MIEESLLISFDIVGDAGAKIATARAQLIRSEPLVADIIQEQRPRGLRSATALIELLLMTSSSRRWRRSTSASIVITGPIWSTGSFVAGLTAKAEVPMMTLSHLRGDRRRPCFPVPYVKLAQTRCNSAQITG